METKNEINARDSKGCRDNIYNKICVICNDFFIGVGKGPGVCEDCEKKMYSKKDTPTIHFRLKFQYIDEDRFLFLPIAATEFESALREAMDWIKNGNKKVKSAYLIKEEKSETIVWSMEDMEC